MNDPRPAGPAALLLLRAGVEPVARWLTKGVTPAVAVETTGGWTLVAPAAAASFAAAPYDDAGDTLLARPVPRACRPAVGLRVVGARLLVCVVEATLAGPVRWLAWETGRGLLEPGGLPSAGLPRLARAAGRTGGRTLEQLREVLAAHAEHPLDVAVEVLDVLRLPGGPVLAGAVFPSDEPGARHVRPHRRFVTAFDRAVGESHTVPADEEKYP